MITNIGRFFVLVILLVVLYAAARCQDITFETPTDWPPSEQNQPQWKLSFTATFQSKLETDNKLSLIDAPVSLTSAQFSKADRYGRTELKSLFGFASKQTLNNHYLGFAVERNQRLSQAFDLKVGGSYHYTRTRRFSSVYAGVNAKLHEAGIDLSESRPRIERTELFSKVEYFTPTEAGFRINRGYTVSGGIENRISLGRIWLQPTAQIIWDNGAIQPGKRTIGNLDLMIGYRFNRLCLGGGLDYSRFFSGQVHERNSVIGKFFIRYN